MKHIYTSLDIGSDSIKIVVCELYQNKLNLLASSSYKSKGIKKGLIVDVEKASESIKYAIKDIKDMLGIDIDKVIVSVPSYFNEYSVAKAEIQLENENSIVTYDDIRNVLEKSIQSKEEDDKEIINYIPVDFSVDEEKGIINPLNKSGNKLSSRSIVVSTQKKYVYSVISLLESIGIEAVDISTTCIGDIYAFKNKEIDNSIGIIINIGSEVTTISLYNRGVIVKNSVINMGGKNITKDISYMYKTDFNTANDLKLHFALAHKRNASTSDTYEIETDYDNELKINQYEISEIVSSRLEEILNLAKKEINILTSKQIDYIIITGGTSNIADIKYTINDIFGRKVSIGNLKLIGIRDNKYSSCLGNIIYFINKLKLKGEEYTMIDDEESLKLASNKNNYQDINNETMLEKITDCFLANRRI